MKAETRGLGKPKEMCRDGSYFTVLTYHDAPYIHDFVKQFFEPETEESRKKRFSPFKFKQIQ